MSARVDQRDVLERLADHVDAVEFELSNPRNPVDRCACGATLLTFSDARRRFVCAGCGELPTYWLDKIHPAPVLAQSYLGDWERGVPPVSSAEMTVARKDADAPGGSCVSSGSGVLGRLGYALRSLRFRVNWGVVDGLVITAAVWTLVLTVLL